MIRRLGVSIAAMAVVGVCMAAAFSPHERGSPPTIEESTVISDAVLRAPELAINPLAAVYVIAERPTSAVPISVSSEPVVPGDATRSFYFDRSRDELPLTAGGFRTCDGSFLCRRTSPGAYPVTRSTS